MRSTIAVRAAAALVIALAFVAPARAGGGGAIEKPKGDPTLVMATVNGDKVTAGDLVKLFSDRHGGHAAFLGGPVEARSFLDRVIDEALLTQESYNLALDEEEEVVKELREYSDKQIAELLVRLEIFEKMKPTDAEVQAAWQRLNVVLQARQIALATRTDAEEVRAALLRGYDPDALARKCSGARSSRNGGNIMVSWGQFPQDWEAAVLPLEPGEVSPVIETKDGFEVVMVVNRVETPLPELKSVSEQIFNTLGQRKSAQREAEFSRLLWERYGAKIVLADTTAFGLLKTYRETPDAIVATWQGDGKLKLSDTFSEDEIRQVGSLPPKRARHEIEQRIRITVNAPLVVLEARARKLEEHNDVAPKIAEYREYLMKNMLFRDHIFKGVVGSEVDFVKYFEANKLAFEKPQQYHVAQIMVPTEKDAKEAAAKIAAGAEFATVVEKFSKDMVSAATGGDLGWVTTDKVPQAFAEVLTLAPGAVTKPIRNSNGTWHIIKLLEVQPKRVPKYEEVKDEVQKAALEKAKVDARAQWISKLRAASEIEVYDAAIKQFVDEHRTDLSEPPPQHAPRG